MEWAKIKTITGKKIEKEQVNKAMALVCSKSFKVNDFLDYLDSQLNLDDLLPDKALLHKLNNIFGLKLMPALRQIDVILNRDYLGWTREERAEAKDKLEMYGKQFLAFRAYAEQLDSSQDCNSDSRGSPEQSHTRTKE